MFLIFDTETTGLPKDFNAPITDSQNWPRMVQISWQLHDDMGNLVEQQDYIIKPEGYNIPFESQNIHGISTALAEQEGHDLAEVLSKFNDAINKADFVVGHNINFDINITGAEFYRKNIKTKIVSKPKLDTMTEKTATLCKLPGGRGNRYKLPKLGELYKHLFGKDFQEAHNATADVEATAQIFFELIRTGLFTAEELRKTPDYFENFIQHNPEPFKPIGLKHKNLKKWSAEIQEKSFATDEIEHSDKTETLENVSFTHLHNHTQYSVLQSTTKLKELIKKTADYGMPAVAITDINNIMGAFHFVETVLGYNKAVEKEKQIKPIVGIELNIVEDQTDRTKKDLGYATVFLAKNKKGYQNLIKLSSIAHTEGFYYVPRVDKKVVEKYKENLIVLSGNLNGEIAKKILTLGDKQAEEALLWWKKTFGEDYYLELVQHGLDEEKHVNQIIKSFSKKHKIKLVATNDTFYLDQEDADAQDILLCIRDNEKKSTPIGRGRGFRYGLPNNEYYFKSPEQMKELFKDTPEAIINTNEIVDKVETYSLKNEILLPKYNIPEDFVEPESYNEFFEQLEETTAKIKKKPKKKLDPESRRENAYLRFLTYEGAKKRYGEITPELRERLDFELTTIGVTGYPGYFLIVQDIIREAKKMGVMCGPGRGSAAGSVVAYCLDITNVEPIKYQLLFERFLNPERVSMPDIDMDFDDEGREKVIEYVINKYGRSRVAQIITYGTMAAKSSIRDAARTMEFSLEETNKLAKKAHVSLDLILSQDEAKIKDKAKRQELVTEALELAKIAQGNDQAAHTIQTAGKLEGSLRNLGLHACGFIIAPTDLDNVVPVTTAKGSDMFVTQFDNSVVEDAGLLKMDFLGIKTLTIIRDALQMIEEHQKIKIDIENLPLDDANTYRLFQKGQTVTVFQFESDGMRKHLMSLRPTDFEDLIAMVALYRPGPMEKIPSYVRRKHGQEKVTYDLPEMEEILKNTYGITVYQEQVMLLSQKLADFTKGQADKLRKAMGKKKIKELEEMYPLFIENGTKNGHPKAILDKIWKDWQAFASYAFNRSHAVSYALVSYQTAYLKANYPSEYMAAVLSHNLKDAGKLSFLMMEARKMGIEVLPPDVNESKYLYTVNQKGNIRYGLGGASGVGEIAVRSIISEREKNGLYKSFFDFIKRVDLRAVNKRTIETLVKAGAFDCFEGVHRAQYLQTDAKGITFVEKAIKFGNNFKKNQASMQTSLFGDSEEVQIPEPEIPQCEPWNELEKLEKEKEVTGLYLSGHPLDSFITQYKYYSQKSIYFINKMIRTLSGNDKDEAKAEGEEIIETEEDKTSKLEERKRFEAMMNRDILIGGMVTGTRFFEFGTGSKKGVLTIEDYTDNIDLELWNEDYLKHKHFFVPKTFVLVKIKIYRNYHNPEQLRIRVNDIQMLNEVFDKNPKDITINLPINVVDNDLIESLLQTFEKFKGKQRVKFNLIDPNEPELNVRLTTGKTGVKLSVDLIKYLEKLKIKFNLK